MMETAFIIVVVLLLLLRIWRRPAEIAIVACVISSSFPAVSSYLGIGQKSFDIRFEYILVFLGLLLAFPPQGRRFAIPQTIVSKLALLMVILHTCSIIIALYWEVYVGVGIATRLIATFGYYFIFVRLTDRRDIPRLTQLLISLGAMIAFLMLVVSATGSRVLVDLLGGGGTYDTARLIGHQAYGQGVTWQRENIEALPMIGVIAFILFMTKKRWRYLYGLATLLVFLQILTSGQRSSTLAIFIGLMVVFLVFARSNYYRPKHGSLIASILFVVSVAYALLAYTDALGQGLDLLVSRSEAALSDVTSEWQVMGQILAFDKLNTDGWMAWLFGYSGFVEAEIFGPGRSYLDETYVHFDINTPLLMVYRFGIIGLLVMIALLYHALKRSWRMIRSYQLLPEELAVTIALFLYILVWSLGSFIRGFVFAENFSVLSWFVIWLAWVEIIGRDYTKEHIRDGSQSVSEVNSTNAVDVQPKLLSR